MKTKCYSVRLLSLTRISGKCFKATAFDGSSDLVPISQIFGIDYEVQKSNAYWISAWILEKKVLQYSDKKIGWFNPDTDCIEPNCSVIIEHHIPEPVEAKEMQPDASLIR